MVYYGRDLEIKPRLTLDRLGPLEAMHLVLRITLLMYNIVMDIQLRQLPCRYQRLLPGCHF